MKKTLLFVIFVLSVLIFVTGCKKKEQYLDQGGWVDLSDEDIATITRNYNGSWHTTTMINGSMKDVYLDIKDGLANFLYFDAGEDYDVFYDRNSNVART